MPYRPVFFVTLLGLFAALGCSGTSDPAQKLPATNSGPSADALDDAYRELIQNEEKFANILAGIHSQAGAEQALGPLQQMFREKDEIYKRLGELGAEAPPAGIPPAHRAQYKAARDLQDSVNQRLAAHPEGEAINQVLMTALGHEVNKASRLEPFRLDAELRRHGKENIVYVLLRNREGLAGPQHQTMVQMLQQTAEARHAEALIEDDGRYFVALAPVSDLEAFARKINFGSVSEIDPAARRFVLTLDPAKIPGEAVASSRAPHAGPPGSPFGPGNAPHGAPSGGAPSSPASGVGGDIGEFEKQQIEGMRTTLAGAHGRNGILEVHMKNAGSLPGAQMGVVAREISQATQGRMIQPIRLRSGGMYAFFQSSADVNQVAAALDLGQVEDVDGPGRRLVITLDPAKVPRQP
jgi:hypothetical protein